MHVQAIWGPLNRGGSDPFAETKRAELAQSARRMFFHAYTSYLRHGYPADDVRPISCTPANSQVHKLTRYAC